MVTAKQHTDNITTEFMVIVQMWCCLNDTLGAWKEHVGVIETR